MKTFFNGIDSFYSGMRVLDAGCGTGISTLALLQVFDRHKYKPACIHGFDLTPKMLSFFKNQLNKNNIKDVQLLEANVLELERLPSTWTEYDLIISTAMLEYIPKASLVSALNGLRSRLSENGSLFLCITKDNWLMRLMIKWPWSANVYSSMELEESFEEAGFKHVNFKKFPWRYGWLNLWGHIVEAS